MLFHRGDVFISGTDGVQEYTPTGRLRRTLPGTSGAGAICFDRTGKHLILPGVGLFDSAGNPVPSNWASVTPPYPRCVVDGFGHVYVIGSDTDSVQLREYDTEGNLVQSFNGLAWGGTPQRSIDLAPDECTLYTGGWGDNYGIAQYNACTHTQVTVGSLSLVDDLRVLPNWQVLWTYDTAVLLVDPSGQRTGVFMPVDTQSFRVMDLDPDGTSAWVCCDDGGLLYHFGIYTGGVIGKWTPSSRGPIAVYGPALFGDANVESTVDSKTVGSAEAFSTEAGYSGRMTRLHVWVDSSSTASTATVGVYADRVVRPGALLTQGTITNLRPGSWNYVDVPSIRVRKGQRYWIAVLAPSGSGTLSVRDRAIGGLSWTTGQHTLSALPAQWPIASLPGLSSDLSAYGS